ncbi:MAG: aldo/keto reductase [Steroidobacteraceae bacterium]
MRLRTLGRTGLAVSEIGFGCGPTAALMIQGSAEQRREAVACALDLGINYFDTAPGYANTVSETHLGLTLRELNARPFIATKVALSFDQLDDIGAAVERSVEQSLQRLQVDQITLIQLHNRIAVQRAAQGELGNAAVLSLEDVVGVNGVAAAFERLRMRGLVRFSGCSAFGGDMPMVGQVVEAGRFDVLTVHYSVLNRTAWSAGADPAVRDYARIGAHANSRQMGIVALRVLEGGTLTADAAANGVGEIRVRFALRNVDVVEGALRFVLSNPQIAVTLVGFSNIEQIKQACTYASRGPLPQELLHAIASY